MVLVSNHCRSFFLLFFILTYVNANQFTFPQSFSCSSQVSSAGCLLSAPQMQVHWIIEQPPASFTLFLVQDSPGQQTITTKPIAPSKGQTSGNVNLNGVLQPGTYRVTAGNNSNTQGIGSSSKLVVTLSSSGTTSRASASQTKSTASPQASSSITTGEVTTAIVSTTSTSEQTQSGGSDGSGPAASTANESGASSQSAASQIGTSSSTAATTANNPTTLSSSVSATQKSSSETDARYVPSTDPAPSSPSSPVAASSNNDSSSKVGIIVGAVLGAIAFLGLLTCTGVVLLKRCNRKRAEQLLIRDMLAAPPYSQRSSTMTRIVDDEVLEKQLLEWKYGPGGLAEEAGVQRRLQEWKYGGVSRCETPCSSV